MRKVFFRKDNFATEVDGIGLIINHDVLIEFSKYLQKKAGSKTAAPVAAPAATPEKAAAPAEKAGKGGKKGKK